MNEPAEGVGAIACALRATQHFNLPYVEQRGHHAKATEVHAVDEEPDGRVGRTFILFEFANAAYLEVAWPRTGAGKVQVRHLGHGVGEVLGTRRL